MLIADISFPGEDLYNTSKDKCVLGPTFFVGKKRKTGRSQNFHSERLFPVIGENMAYLILLERLLESSNGLFIARYFLP